MHDIILSRILADASRELDGPVTQTVIGGHMVGVAGGRAGIATRIGSDHGRQPEPTSASLPATLLELAERILAPADDAAHPQARALALAAINALTPPPQEASELPGQQLIAEHGGGKHVVVVGHFPFVERMDREGKVFASLAVLELAPRPGDLPADKAAGVLPQADFVAITGTTLLNGSLGGLLALCRPDAHVMLLGPSVPFSPSLFDMGVRTLAGAVVDDTQHAFADIAAGRPFKAVRGTRSLVWTKP
ncbi:hypothetical protein GGQ74_001105 [Desulfobaculum xiamenense]|uniref:Putative heavy-metal chelation domain-containing protein n=1 Tax=Desulfobaculum xiamenense TaxID=995050 RepID=A0A846QPY5_9BACT|nr:DUF364 domain-containing protein [Desulfobaculum xiamenense]NJB67465.1 hypothetical protein [Desulfobaculum xiamenense]